jgi:hypothetical protein
VKRRAAYILCMVDFAIWAAIAGLIGLYSGPWTLGLDRAALSAVTVLLLLTALPGALLARWGRFPDAALGFALAFPGAFAILILISLA